jgi:hypothetical protein
MAIVDIPPEIEKRKIYIVDFVKMDLTLREMFIIQGKGYYIFYFRIIG